MKNLEFNHLARAWFAISLAFTIALVGITFSLYFLVVLLAAMLTVGIGFVFHELAHKFTAQKFGCKAEFRAFDQGLWLAIIVSFFGFVFAAPGAVMIQGKVTKKQNGIISISGALANFAIASLFFVLRLNMPFLQTFTYYGYLVNTWLGLFNLIPFGPLDGRKVFDWSKPVWILALCIGGLLMIAQNFLA